MTRSSTRPEVPGRPCRGGLWGRVSQDGGTQRTGPYRMALVDQAIVWSSWGVPVDELVALRDSVRGLLTRASTGGR
jgi:hypothetical protein